MPIPPSLRAPRSVPVLALTALAACTPAPPAGSSPAVAHGGGIAPLVSQAVIERHTRELSDDRYEGRFPGTRGEELTVDYLQREFRRLGLAPGNPDGGYVQEFRMLAQRNRETARVNLPAGADSLAIGSEALFVVGRGSEPRTVLRESQLVFVGYGIAAPEYGWDDYAGVDVRGKTVLVLLGEPEPRLASDSSRLDTAQFRGAQLTYHAREEHKYEVAQAHGAAGVVVLAPGVAGLRNRIVRNHGAFITLGNEDWPGIVGAIAPAARERIFAGVGRSFRGDSLAAGRRGFRAVPLGASLSLEVQSEWQWIPTRNLIALLPGSDPRLREEYVVYSAHWDAFGIGAVVDGDSIYNGAVDDAVGIGQLFAVADAFTRVRPRPRRSILFLATSGEEQRLLGAQYYVEHPLHPLERTVLNVNFDLVDLVGPTRDETLNGAGRSTVDQIVAAAARLQGRTVRAEGTRADAWLLLDSFPFTRAGVPAFSVAAGADVIGQPPGFAQERARQYRMRDYHRPSDEVRDDWNWGSIVQEAQLAALVGQRVASGAERPRWTDRREFGAERPTP